MRIVIVADSQFGNTTRIAEAIGRGAAGAGDVSVISAGEADAQAVLAEHVDLLIAGGPTVSRGMTPTFARFIDAVATSARGLSVAAFDTRYRGSELLLGSAGKRAAEKLQHAGARMVSPKESFYVVRAEAPRGERSRPGLAKLADGEEARAEAWGRSLVKSVTAGTSA
jgi:flavodoxin